MLQSLRAILPRDEASINGWLTVLAIAYVIADIVFSLGFLWISGKTKFSLTAAVSNALLFSTSALLLCGGLNQPTLAALGSLTAFLLFAGLIGVGFSVQELARKR